MVMLQLCMYQNWNVIRKQKMALNSQLFESGKFSIIESFTYANMIAQAGFWIAATFLTLMPYPFYWILIPLSESWKNISLNEIDNYLHSFPENG